MGHNRKDGDRANEQDRPTARQAQRAHDRPGEKGVVLSLWRACRSPFARARATTHRCVSARRLLSAARGPPRPPRPAPPRRALPHLGEDVRT